MIIIQPSGNFYTYYKNYVNLKVKVIILGIVLTYQGPYIISYFCENYQ